MKRIGILEDGSELVQVTREDRERYGALIDSLAMIVGLPPPPVIVKPHRAAAQRASRQHLAPLRGRRKRKAEAEGGSGRRKKKTPRTGLGPETTIGHKQCNRCGKVKPFAEMVKSKVCSGGVRPLCKACLAEQSHRTYMAKHPKSAPRGASSSDLPKDGSGRTIPLHPDV